MTLIFLIVFTFGLNTIRCAQMSRGSCVTVRGYGIGVNGRTVFGVSRTKIPLLTLIPTLLWFRPGLLTVGNAWFTLMKFVFRRKTPGVMVLPFRLMAYVSRHLVSLRFLPAVLISQPLICFILFLSAPGHPFRLTWVTFGRSQRTVVTERQRTH